MGFPRITEALGENLVALYAPDGVFDSDTAGGERFVVAFLLGGEFFTFGFFVRGFDGGADISGISHADAARR